MSDIEKYQKLCKKFKKQGTPPAPINLKNLLTLYLCFEDDKKNLYTRKVAVEYVDHRDILWIRATSNWGDGTIVEGNALPSSGLGQNEYEQISDLVDSKEAINIFESIIDRSVEEIGIKSPFYEALLNNCIWEETDNNHSVSTLAVGWDDKASKFRLYYNPSFILTGALAQYIYCPKDYPNLEECYNYMLKFYLIHEMSHITREHMQKGDLLKEVSHRDINIYGDSFINQVIPVAVLQEQKKHPPIIGILNEITKSGTPKKKSLEYIISDLSKMLGNLTGLPVETTTLSGFSSGGGTVVVKIVMGDLLYRFPNLNSNLFIKEVSQFFNNLFKKDSQDKLQQNPQQGDSQGGGDQGQSQSGDSQSSSGDSKQSSGQGDQSQDSSIEDVLNRERDKSKGSQGAKDESENNTQQGESSQSSDDSSGESDNQSDAQSGEGEDGNDSSKGAQQAIQDALKKSTNEKDLASKLGGEPLTGEMKAGGDSKGKWRTLLAKAISQATGIKELYDTNAPHARIQGQFGRDVEVPDFKTVLILLDCSGSMGAQVFKKVLQELIILESQFKVKPTVHVVYWGDGATHKKYKMNKNIYKQIAADSHNMGGTYYDQAIDYALTVCKNPDLVIDCTDAQFFEMRPTLEKIRKKRMKYSRKTIWVLTKDFDQSVMSVIDPQYKNRMIKLT